MSTLTAAFADSMGDVVALADDHTTRTWAELDARVNRLIHRFRAEGIRPGDTISVVCGNRIEWFEIAFACACSGVTFVPVNWHFVAREIAYIVADSGSKALLCDHLFLDEAAKALDGDVGDQVVVALVIGAPATDRFQSFDDFVDAGSSDEPGEQSFGGPMFYTSGTTGNPKGVRGSLSSMPEGSDPAIWQLIGAGFANLVEGRGTTVLCGPFYHSAQWAYSFLPMIVGSTTVMQHKYDSAGLLRLIDTHRATNVHLVPTQMKRLIDLPDDVKRTFDGSSLQLVLHGAAPCPPAVKHALIEWWGPVITEYYGSTEGSVITMIGAQQWLEKGGSVGPPMPGKEILVVGDDGTLLGPNEVGTLYFRDGMGMDFEYHNAPDKTADVHLEPGVFTTGDVGYLDDDGFLWLSDRKIDMIISGGVNIYPAEIEGVLAGHPMVADAAVIGIPNEDFGEEVKAIVVAADGVVADDELRRTLIATCREQLAGFKVPRSIDFVDDLPRTGTGKIQKAKLREPFWEGRERVTSSGQPAGWLGDSTLGERFPAWTRGNAADVFPDPFSPLGKTLVLRAMSAGLRDAYITLGALSFDEFEQPEAPDLFKIFGGYVYNPLTLTRILGARMPGASPEMIDKAFFDDRDEVPPYVEQPWHVSATHEALLGGSMAWAMSATELPELDADRRLAREQRERRPDLAQLTDAALIARARSMGPLLQQTFENAMRVSSLASLGPGALGAICDGLGDPTLSIRLLAGIEVDSAAPAHAMWKLGRMAASSPEISAAFERDPGEAITTLRTSASPEAADFVDRFEQFLFDHGARAQNEYDPFATSWEVAPHIALAAIDLMRRSDASHAPSDRFRTAVAERDRIAAQVRDRIAADPEAAATFEAAFRSAQVFLGGRERAKTNVVMVINEMRVALRELGRRLVDRRVIDRIEQVFMVTDSELDRLRLHPDTMRGTIAERWSQFRSLFDHVPLFVVDGRVPALSEMTRRSATSRTKLRAGAVLTGTAGSGGVASGRARVILDAADPQGLEPGDILVAPQTDPSWIPLFVPAAGVVVNVGAMGSHAMIVSRELGVPCVASVSDATDLIPDGAIITIDGNAGTVTIDALPDHPQA